MNHEKIAVTGDKKAKKVVIKDFSMTGRERDILQILWDSNKPMIASEFHKVRDDLTINTVQAVLKTLLKREFIQVAEIKYSGTVLSRSYVPTMAEEEFTVASITKDIHDLKKFDITPGSFFVDFLSKNTLSKEDKSLLEEFMKNLK